MVLPSSSRAGSVSQDGSVTDITAFQCCLQVRSDVAALALEEVAPLAVSTAALAAPSEVYKAAAPGGEGKAEQELSR
jgi:U3 small nucleolar ribonucleoprotein component